MTAKKETATESLDLAEMGSLDTSEMTVYRNGAALDWKWIFAGPGHEKAISLRDKLLKKDIARERKIDLARTNGKKYKPEEKTPDDRLNDSVSLVLGRLLGWTPIAFGGKDYEYTEENARKLLKDPKYAWLASQALEFIGDENAFMNSSAKT